MNVDTVAENRAERGANSLAWFAGAIGVGAGVAALLIRRRRETRWDRARHRANELFESAAGQAKPWMGWAAGSAAATTALAVYARNHKGSGWQRASRRARELGAQVGSHAAPWADLAIGAAVALASAASSRKTRRRAIRGAGENAAETMDALVDKGAQLIQRVRKLSDEARHLYPSIRRALA